MPVSGDDGQEVMAGLELAEVIAGRLQYTPPPHVETSDASAVL